MGTTKKYWKGLEERSNNPEFEAAQKSEFPQELPVEEFLGDERLQEASTGRRDFLKFLGFGVAAATVAACETPVIKSIPYVNKPEDITPGVANWYASSYYDGNDFANIMVKTREARPIFIKGNANKGITGGAVNPRVNSSVLSLYDSARLRGPLKEGASATWKTLDDAISKRLKEISERGGSIRLLTNTIISPTMTTIVQEFIAALGGDPIEPVGDEEAAPTSTNIKHITYDAVSFEGIRKANEESFGKNVIPNYKFDAAKTIVSIGADFLNTWLNALEYSTQYGSRRKPVLKETSTDFMSKHFQFESILTTAGASADYRLPIKPSEEGLVAAALYQHITGSSIATVPAEILEVTKEAAAALKHSGNASLVVAGSNDKNVQVIVNAINTKLSSYGTTIDLDNSLNLYKGKDAEVIELVDELGKGKVDALIMIDVNPSYTLPNAEDFSSALSSGKVLSISLSGKQDETASLAQYVAPQHHALEAWNDFNPKKNHYSIAQPTISPLFDTRDAGESLLVWAGRASRGDRNSEVYHDAIKSNWEKYGYPFSQKLFTDFEEYWKTTVHYGSDNSAPVKKEAVSFAGNVSAAGKAVASITSGEFEVVLYQKSAIGIGDQGTNPMLQELPDPISKVTWDNYITMSPLDVAAGNYHDYIGEAHPASVAKVTVNGKSVELPVFPSPGQKAGTIGIALGYGRGDGLENAPERIGRAAFQVGNYGEYEVDENGKPLAVGKNVFGFISSENGVRSTNVFSATVEATGGTYPMATTQTHNTVMGRTSIVKETTLSVYQAGEKHAYNHGHTLPVHEDVDGDGKLTNKDVKPVSSFSLWEEHPVENVGHRWGLSIDLNSCFGCGACVTACNIENNVPVVGKDEVRRAREMHWLRIDRYYSSEGSREEGFGSLEEVSPDEKIEVVFQPMMCQHCNHAPCETVCPVAATTHSNEGLNQMTYNRCIGTRYCANNCPFKVRRFNWFNYMGYKKFEKMNPSQDDFGRMILNPDVTVRARGVMEKCSLCVQTIQAGKLAAKKAGTPVEDGAIQTACSASCSTGAIKFGDLNDVNSEIAKDSKGDRAYVALEEVGVKPNIYYQTKVRNKVSETAHGSADH